jgi:hypothetical protein
MSAAVNLCDVSFSVGLRQMARWPGIESTIDIEEALGYLGYVLQNLSTIWEEKDLDGKQRLQQIVPTGLTWKNFADKGGFEPTGPDVSDSFYRLLADSSVSEGVVVGPEGFEPPTKGL